MIKFSDPLTYKSNSSLHTYSQFFFDRYYVFHIANIQSESGVWVT